MLADLTINQSVLGRFISFPTADFTQCVYSSHLITNGRLTLALERQVASFLTLQRLMPWAKNGGRRLWKSFPAHYQRMPQPPTRDSWKATECSTIMTIWFVRPCQIRDSSIFMNSMQVQRGSNYVATLKMYSSRSRNTECTNLANVSPMD
jgi:hypothetical protein